MFQSDRNAPIAKLIWTLDVDEGSAHVKSVFVHETARGTGLGRLLFYQLFAALRRAGKLPPSHSALGSYSHHGFPRTRRHHSPVELVPHHTSNQLLIVPDFTLLLACTQVLGWCAWRRRRT